MIIGEPIEIMKRYALLGVDPITGNYLFLDADGKATSSPDNDINKTQFINPSPNFYGGLEK